MKAVWIIILMESLIVGISNLKIESDELLDPTMPIEYLSYELVDQIKFKSLIKQKLIEGVEQIKQVFPEIDQQAMIDSISTYKMVANPHTTIAYLGYKTVDYMKNQYKYKSESEKKRVIELLDSFKIGQQISFKLLGFAIVDGKIVTGFVAIDQQREQELKTKSLNDYEHMTLATKAWSAVDSNFLLKSIFDDFNKYEVKYDEQFLIQNRMAKKITITSDIKKFNGEGYMVSFGDQYLESKMATFCHYKKVKQQKQKQKKQKQKQGQKQEQKQE